MDECEPGPSTQPDDTDVFDVEHESTVISDGPFFGIKWVEAISSKDASDLLFYLNDFVSQFYNRNGYSNNFVSQFKRFLNCHGASLPLNKEHSSYTFMELWSVPTRKANERVNLAMLLRRLSVTIGDINMVEYLAQNLTRVVGVQGQNKRTSYSTVPTDRLSLWHVFRRNYIQGMENSLESNVYLRYFENYHYNLNMHHKALRDYRNESHKYLFITQATYTAVQVVIQNRRTPSKFRGDQLVQLAHSHVVQLCHMKFLNDVLVHLNEILICAICLNLPKVQQELAEFESFIKHKNARFSIPWTSWQILSKYESASGTSSRNNFSFLMDAKRLAESVDNTEIGIKGTVFVEEACKIWGKSRENEDDIRNLIIDYNQQYPALGPRMVELAKYCNLEYEVDSLIDDMCSDEKLHASEKVWLDWVERRLKNPGRFGAVETIIEKCLKITFEYLDFGSNRFSCQAWRLLHDVLQKASASMVMKEWKTRFDWWAKFHSKNENFDKNTRKLKKEVLAALAEIVIEN